MHQREQPKRTGRHEAESLRRAPFPQEHKNLNRRCSKNEGPENPSVGARVVHVDDAVVHMRMGASGVVRSFMGHHVARRGPVLRHLLGAGLGSKSSSNKKRIEVEVDEGGNTTGIIHTGTK